MSGITSFFVGDKKAPTANLAYQPVDSTSTESRLTEAMNNNLSSAYADQGNKGEANQINANDITSLFTQHLKDFLAQTQQQQQQAGTDFVDQTFTNPAQAAVNQNLADAQSQGSARAAALGRNPNADIATQQALLGETQRQNIGLQAERGSRIQSATNDIYNRGLNGLNAGMQGSGFLNNLTQQAFQNQLGLLNGQSGLAQYYQRGRAVQGYTPNASSGLLTNIGAITNAATGPARNILSTVGGGSSVDSWGNSGNGMSSFSGVGSTANAGDSGGSGIGKGIGSMAAFV